MKLVIAGRAARAPCMSCCAVLASASDLPARDALTKEGAKAADIVPWSAVVWYQVAFGAACR